MSSERPAYKAKYDECKDDLRRKEIDCEKDIRKASRRDFADLIDNIKRYAGRFTYQQALDIINKMASTRRAFNVLNPMFDNVGLWNEKEKLDAILKKFGESYGDALVTFLDGFRVVDEDLHSVMRVAVENIKLLNK